MTRLRDELHSPDPRVAHAARLVAAVPPLERSEARQRRVAAALAEAPHRRPRTLLLRFAIALAILAAGAGAWAAIGRDLYRHLVEHAATHSQPPAHEPSPHAAPTNPPPASPASISPIVTPPPRPQAPASPNTAAPPPPAHPSHAPDRPRTKIQSKAPTHADPAANVRDAAREHLEAQSVLDAVNALRRDHDPDRARLSLIYYLDRFPEGAVAEEALALLIEADTAAGNHAEAATFAARYLRTYPDGKFVEAARRAQSESER
jgi:hypothetical protein